MSNASLKFIFNAMNTTQLYLTVLFEKNAYTMADNNQVDFSFEDKKDFCKILKTLVENMSNATRIEGKPLFKVCLILPRDRLEDGLRFYDANIQFVLNSFLEQPTEAQLNQYLGYLTDIPNSIPKFQFAGIHYKSVSENDMFYIANFDSNYNVHTVIHVQNSLYILQTTSHSAKYHTKQVEHEKFNIYSGTNVILRCFATLNDCETISQRISKYFS